MSRFQTSPRARLGIGAAVLLALGAAGGAGAVSLTRPSIEMAPTVQTPIAKLSATSGIVTVKGRVAEVFGDRVVLQDATGRTMVDTGRAAGSSIAKGAALTVQGRYDDGQLRSSFLVDASGMITPVGPPRGGPGPRGPHGPGHDGPPPPRAPGAAEGQEAPPPPPSCAPAAAPAA